MQLFSTSFQPNTSECSSKCIEIISSFIRLRVLFSFLNLIQKSILLRGEDSLMVMFFGRCWMKELQFSGSAMDRASTTIQNSHHQINFQNHNLHSKIKQNDPKFIELESTRNNLECNETQYSIMLNVNLSDNNYQTSESQLK